MSNPVYLALDVPSLEPAKALVEKVRSHIGGVKLGLEFFCKEGDPLWTMDDEALKALGHREMVQIGLVQADALKDQSGCKLLAFVHHRAVDDEHAVGGVGRVAGAVHVQLWQLGALFGRQVREAAHARIAGVGDLRLGGRWLGAADRGGGAVGRVRGLGDHWRFGPQDGGHQRGGTARVWLACGRC